MNTDKRKTDGCTAPSRSIAFLKKKERKQTTQGRDGRLGHEFFCFSSALSPLARLRRVEQAVQGLPSEKRAALEARPPRTVQYASAERARKGAAPITMNPMVMGPMMANSGGLDFLDDFLGLFDTECEQRQRPHARAHRRAAAGVSRTRPLGACSLVSRSRATPRCA